MVLHTEQNEVAQQTRENPVLDAALAYRRRSWSIIPIAHGSKKPPKGFRWKKYQKQLPAESDLRDWFADREDLGLAVLLGDISGGLVCRDFDDKASYSGWKRNYVDLARMLPTARTHRGFHVYFRTSAENLFFRDLRPAECGEYRGDSQHYCLLPPSLHPDGSIYEWDVPLALADVPHIADVVAAGLLPAGDETQKAHGKPKKSQVVVGGCRPNGARTRLSPAAELAIDGAISRTMPTGPGTRRGKLFELARLLKFDPEFAGVPASDIDFLIPYLQRWWRKAKPHTSGTHSHFHQSWEDFVFAWEEARVPVGATMQAFLEMARQQPAPRKAVELYGEGSRRTVLASLCRVLQSNAGTQPFPLSGRVVRPLLSVSDTQAWRWIRQLAQDGIIKAAKKYPRSKRLATEWRYVGD